MSLRDLLDIYDYEDLNEKEVLLDLLKTKDETHGTHLISFYFKKLKQDHAIKLRKQLAESKNIKSKDTQKIVGEGITTLLDVVNKLLANQEQFNSPGVIFVKGDFYAVLKLPEYYNIELYYCGKVFRTDLLSENVEKVWGLIVLDTKEVCIGVFSNNLVTVLDNFDVFLPHKMKAGGQSAARFEETRKNKVLDLIEKVSQIVNERFEKYNIDKVLLGGVIPTTTNFYLNNSLYPKYRSLLKEPTPTCYTNSLGLQQLIERNKAEYDEQLKSYYEEKAQYDRVLLDLSEKIFSDEMIVSVELKKPKAIWALAGTTNLGYYCNDCKQIYLRPSECSHSIKVNLKQDPEISKYYFNPKSRFGALIIRLGKVFYETTFVA